MTLSNQRPQYNPGNLLFPTEIRSEVNYRRYRPKGKLLGYGILAIIIAVFSAWQLRSLVTYPSLGFDNAVDVEGFNLVEDNIFTLSGTTDRVAYLLINDEERPITTDDTFSYQFFVPPGEMTLDITVRDRYRRSNSYSITLFNPIENLSLAERNVVATQAIQDFKDKKAGR